MDAREESPVEMALLILVTAVFPRISGIGSYHIYVTVVIGLTGLELVATVQTCRISALVVRNALGEIAFQAMGVPELLAADVLPALDALCYHPAAPSRVTGHYEHCVHLPPRLFRRGFSSGYWRQWRY